MIVVFWGHGVGISIHAPVKGATGCNPSPSTRRGNFNPRSREGSDTTVESDKIRRIDFNPRSREGSDS